MKTVIFFLCIFLSTSGKAQERANRDDDSSRIIGHVYHVKAWPSIGFTVGGQIAVILGQRYFSKPEITNQEFDAAQSSASINSINAMDRWALRLNIPTVDYTWTAVGIQTACAAAPLALFFGERYRKNWDDIVLMLLEVNTISLAMFQFSPFGPFFQNRFRPAVYYAKDSVARYNERNGGERNSMFSGHENSAAASLFFMAKVYCDYNPQIQGWDKFGIYALASVPPLIMGCFRVIALRHFPTDVIIGGIVGGTVGILVPEFHRIINNTNVSVGMYSSPEGTGINLALNLK